jgi:hypothetical protein
LGFLRRWRDLVVHDMGRLWVPGALLISSLPARAVSMLVTLAWISVGVMAWLIVAHL